MDHKENMSSRDCQLAAFVYKTVIELCGSERRGITEFVHYLIYSNIIVHAYGPYSVPENLLNLFHILTHLILITL